MSKKIIMTPQDIGRTLARMAHEIIEHTRTTDSLILIGIPTRGVPLAKRLAANIEAFEQTKIPVGTLDISLHRDDLSSLDLQSTNCQSSIPVDINDKRIVLVDDVLYTGRSTRAAMDALIELGRPQSIQLAVLIDRGHRELPIRADYVGKNIPSSRNEKIQVSLKEVDGIDEVAIIDLVQKQPLKKRLRAKYSIEFSDA